jgi:hypothetical protein
MAGFWAGEATRCVALEARAALATARRPHTAHLAAATTTMAPFSPRPGLPPAQRVGAPERGGKILPLPLFPATAAVARRKSSAFETRQPLDARVNPEHGS